MRLLRPILLSLLVLAGCSGPNRKVDFPPIPVAQQVARRIGPVQGLVVPQQYYLRWDRPYPEAPTNRYEIWMTTNLFASVEAITAHIPPPEGVGWWAITNTRFGEMKLDVTQYQQAWFIVRTALYEWDTNTNDVWWDGPVDYSDWSHSGD